VKADAAVVTCTELPKEFDALDKLIATGKMGPPANEAVVPVVFTVMFAPKLTVVTPAMKFDPVSSTSSV
jgi:hypothetical protein